MNRSVIFLDFDGVLNTEQYQAQLAIEGKPTKDAWGPLFDPRAVENLCKILVATEAKIVISSSWRYAHRLSSLRRMWKVRGLQGEVFDTIPCGATYISRGEDIECWLDRNGRPDYVIIDDLDDFFLSQHDRYVETNPIVGITEADAQNAIKILNSKSNNMKDVSNWNGYSAYGDVKELDRIVETTGMINLTKDDIVSVLSAEGENWISVGNGSNLNDAFNEAINDFPCKIDKINALLIDFRCGNKQPTMSELSIAQTALAEVNKEVEVTWGITFDELLGEVYQVVLVASLRR